MTRVSSGFAVIIRDRCIQGFEWLLDGILCSSIGEWFVNLFTKVDKHFAHEDYEEEEEENDDS
jgi:hypothetical protein